MIFNIILLIILVTSLIIILLIVFKKLSLVAAVELDAMSQQQAEIKRSLLQQKFRRESQLFARKLGMFLKQAGKTIRSWWVKIFLHKNKPQTP